MMKWSFQGSKKCKWWNDEMSRNFLQCFSWSFQEIPFQNSKSAAHRPRFWSFQSPDPWDKVPPKMREPAGECSFNHSTERNWMISLDIDLEILWRQLGWGFWMVPKTVQRRSMRLEIVVQWLSPGSPIVANAIPQNGDFIRDLSQSKPRRSGSKKEPWFSFQKSVVKTM